MASEATLQPMVDAANAAIIALITKGQEVRVNGRTYRRAELSQLKTVRDQLEAELARVKGGGLRVNQVVPRG